ncbi:hypothetical protein [Zavarzinia sp.]|uniref:hypothetical protein n=1 Tax=Zavarzinia sp. TaxID=2027920 RepID=UPI003BB6850C
MTNTPKPVEGGRYELIDGDLVQLQAPTAPGAGGPRNADGTSMYTTDKFRPAPAEAPTSSPIPAPPVPAEAPIAEPDPPIGEPETPKKKR